MPESILAAVPDSPSPSDVIYDDMTRAWRNGDYPLAWSLADTLLQYEACGGPDGNGGEPLTGPDRDMAYVHAIRARYAPEPAPAPGMPVSKNCQSCGGPLEPSSYGGYVHQDDADDTHVPVDPSPVAE